MQRSNRGPKYILCVIDEVTIYLIMIPIQQFRSEEIGDVLIENVMTQYCVCDNMIMNQETRYQNKNSSTLQ